VTHQQVLKESLQDSKALEGLEGLTELQDIWAQLGASEDHRLQTIRKVSKFSPDALVSDPHLTVCPFQVSHAVADTCSQQLSEARDLWRSTQAAVEALMDKLRRTHRALGRSWKDPGGAGTSSEGLLAKKARLEEELRAASAELAERAEAVRKLSREADKLARSLRLDGKGDKALTELLALAKESTALVSALEGGTSAMVLSDEQLMSWEHAVRSMRVMRANMLADVDKLSREAHGAVLTLDMDGRSLNAVVVKATQREQAAGTTLAAQLDVRT
jgi:hypothetical protein